MRDFDENCNLGFSWEIGDFVVFGFWGFVRFGVCVVCERERGRVVVFEGREKWAVCELWSVNDLWFLALGEG